MPSNFEPRGVFQAYLHRCIVTAVYPYTTMVDVYIPQTGSQYSNVYVLMPTFTTTSGVISMPEVNSAGILAIYHSSYPPVFLGCMPPFGFNNDSLTFERVLPGETRISSQKGGFIDVDAAGNISSGTGLKNIRYVDASGAEYTLGSSKVYATPLSKNSLHIEQKNDIINLKNTFEFYQRSKVESAQDVIDTAKKNIKMLSGENNIVDKTKSMIEAVLNDRSVNKSDISAYESFLNDCKMTGDGVKVSGMMFDEGILKIRVTKDGDLIAGIEIDENGGRLTGKWEV